jgi:hypothetical protein
MGGLIVGGAGANPVGDGFEFRSRHATHFGHLAAKTEIRSKDLVDKIAGSGLSCFHPQSASSALCRGLPHKLAIGFGGSQIERSLGLVASVAADGRAALGQERLNFRRKRDAGRTASTHTTTATQTGGTYISAAAAVLGVSLRIDARSTTAVAIAADFFRAANNIASPAVARIRLEVDAT